ncbi:hypothetical protein LWC34_45210 [Kibdelosporangium philippinense]|uniref:Uncharacterized protein n=1 Tax=Kibdelosporangium philippinense TaxID=211113 RepID=A0ABS8ZQF9_9PSEU|nr:hypothetical protein [Kibdelosporangium philippinense]MCE7009959.1 hypothetical protein [Kibdelosporangium philippinense]
MTPRHGALLGHALKGSARGDDAGVGERNRNGGTDWAIMSCSARSTAGLVDVCKPVR